MKKIIHILGIACLVYCSDTAVFSQGKPETYTISANATYGDAGNAKRFLFGDHFRQEWAAQVEVEIFNLDSLTEELTPTKMGGGMQTKSLRLEDKNGKEYVLRSLDKDPSKVLPPEMVGTFADDILQDQISSSNPYAPLAVAQLAEQAGVMHTTPKIVFVSEAKKLGEFNTLFANTLCLLEERPIGSQKNNPAFNYSAKVINSQKLFEELKGDTEHQVDQYEFLKARLFDIWIGDWDRHEDQWLWATFKEGEQTIYRPIPRDRDQAFVSLDGLIPQIAARKWAVRRTQHFDYTIRDVAGLNMSGNNLDRLFTNSLTWKDWTEVTLKLKQKLTDQVIEDAVKLLPPQIFALSGNEIISKLKQRRDDLPAYALSYYNFLAKEVDVLGSDRDEQFEINRLEDGSTKVKVIRISRKSDSRVVFDRTFNSSETKVINLYGLKGEDHYLLSGDSKKGIYIRIIGGHGADSVNDNSHIAGFAKKTTVLVDDTDQVLGRNEFRIVKGDSLETTFVRKRNMYDRVSPIVSPGYNPDDGVYIGGGVSFRNHAFGKAPFANQQSIWGNVALATKAFNFQYNGLFIDAFGTWDLNVLTKVNGPNFIYNFYGFGNETENNHSWSYHRVRLNEVIISPSISQSLGRFHTIRLGAEYQSVDVERTKDRFISDSGLESSMFTRKDFGSVFMQYTLNTTNDIFYPTKGVKLNAGAEFTKRLNHTNNFGKFTADVSSYLSLGKRFVLASHNGISTISNGDYEFYQASSLGGLSNLRGYRRTRFAGKTSVYQNAELRYKAGTLKGYVIRGNYGLLTFFDHGRVWQPGEHSNKWHNGFGVGAWVLPYNKIAFAVTYAYSEEGGMVHAKAGFMF